MVLQDRGISCYVHAPYFMKTSLYCLPPMKISDPFFKTVPYFTKPSLSMNPTFLGKLFLSSIQSFHWLAMKKKEKTRLKLTEHLFHITPFLL